VTVRPSRPGSPALEVGGAARCRPRRPARRGGRARPTGCARRRIRPAGPGTPAGVSHAAPAYHFGDKAGLLTVIAADGFWRLADALREAYASTGSFLEVGVAYVRFAVSNKAHFEVMFRPSCTALMTQRSSAPARRRGRCSTARSPARPNLAQTSCAPVWPPGRWSTGWPPCGWTTTCHRSSATTRSRSPARSPATCSSPATSSLARPGLAVAEPLRSGVRPVAAAGALGRRRRGHGPAGPRQRQPGRRRRGVRPSPNRCLRRRRSP
jgi:hypothetical protein